MADDEVERPEWMKNISSTVNPEDYLLGRKIDKTFELSKQEKLDKAKEVRENLIANDKIKLAHDPILEIEKRKETLKREILSNPVKMKQFKDHILRKGGYATRRTDSRADNNDKERSSSHHRHHRSSQHTQRHHYDRHDRNDRLDRQDRHDRHGRHDRHEHHHRSHRGGRGEDDSGHRHHRHRSKEHDRTTRDRRSRDT